MIKLSDFARGQGVTDRQIQRLIKKYAAEIEGMYERKGPNGTWLSEEACDILRSKMKSQPVELYDDKKDKLIKELEVAKKELQEENDKLRKERDKAQDDLFAAKQVIIGLKENEILYLEEKNKTENLQKQLEFSNDEVQKLNEELAHERTKKLTFKERFFGKRGV